MKTTVLAVSFVLLATTLPADTAGVLEKSRKTILDKGSPKEVMDSKSSFRRTPCASYAAQNSNGENWWAILDSDQ